MGRANVRLKVHVLATCRKPELVRATTLVAATLRTGFPTARIVVYDNAIDDPECVKTVYAAFEKSADEIVPIKRTIHHEWIESLLASHDDPFFILDTDVVFWDSMEGLDFKSAPLSGRYIPRFWDQFTKCITMPRLHGALLYLDPKEIRRWSELYFSMFPQTPFNPRPNLIYPGFFPVREGARITSYFHDTLCLMYHAIGGLAFTEEILNRYDHLNCGTISDMVGDAYGQDWKKQHQAIFDNPALLRGNWKSDDLFYAAHAA